MTGYRDYPDEEDLRRRREQLAESYKKIVEKLPRGPSLEPPVDPSKGRKEFFGDLVY